MTKLSIKERTTVEARIWQMQTCDGRLRQLDHIGSYKKQVLRIYLLVDNFRFR